MACIQQNGIYKLTNAIGGTCLDLSGGDNYSIIGYGFHNGPNQAWIFEPVQGKEKTYYLKSAGSGQYLAAESEPVRDGLKVIASGSPFAWRVEDDRSVDSGVRLLPDSSPYFCVDLSDNGNSTPGTPVELWGKWEGKNQIWKLEQIR